MDKHGVDSHPEENQRSSWTSNSRENLRLGLLILAWYFFSSLSNSLSKSILLIFPYAGMLTMAQFGFIVCYCFLLIRVFKIFPYKKTTWKQVIYQVSPLSIGHIFANVCTHVSYEYISVSFAHTIKATSPIFTVILSKIYLKESTSLPVMASLVPIILGVALSSSTELQFSTVGFLMALISTVIFSAQNVYSKRLFHEQQMDYITLLSNAASVSFFLIMPFCLLAELPFIEYNESWLKLACLYFFNGFCHFMQNILAFSALSKIAPLTYAISNTFKRIFVIATSILYFHNHVSASNAFGIVIAIGGVALYNKTRHDLKNKKALLPERPSHR